MNKYVVDLETAKKLKDYLPEGWESEHYWQRIRFLSSSAIWHPWDKWRLIPKDERISGLGKREVEHIYAPILSEMLELLPQVVRFNRCILLTCDLMHYDKCERLCKPEIKIAGYGGNIGYVCANNRFQWNIPYFNNAKNESENDINPATAAALLYMWLVDEGYTGEKLFLV